MELAIRFNLIDAITLWVDSTQPSWKIQFACGRPGKHSPRLFDLDKFEHGSRAVACADSTDARVVSFAQETGRPAREKIIIFHAQSLAPAATTGARREHPRDRAGTDVTDSGPFARVARVVKFFRSFLGPPPPPPKSCGRVLFNSVPSARRISAARHHTRFPVRPAPPTPHPCVIYYTRVARHRCRRIDVFRKSRRSQIPVNRDSDFDRNADANRRLVKP